MQANNLRLWRCPLTFPPGIFRGSGGLRVTSGRTCGPSCTWRSRVTMLLSFISVGTLLFSLLLCYSTKLTTVFPHQPLRIIGFISSLFCRCYRFHSCVTHKRFRDQHHVIQFLLCTLEVTLQSVSICVGHHVCTVHVYKSIDLKMLHGQLKHTHTWQGFISAETGVSVFFCSSTGTMLVPTLTFWGLNTLLLVVDTTGKPSFITRYRIQLDKNNPVCGTQVLSPSSGPHREGLKCV